MGQTYEGGRVNDMTILRDRLTSKYLKSLSQLFLNYLPLIADRYKLY